MSTSPWSADAWLVPELAASARPAAGDVARSLDLGRRHEDVVAAWGHDTWQVLSALATLGSVDLTTARVVEPHWDALAILDQAGLARDAGQTWGVYAATPPGTTLAATRSGGGWRLTGRKPWCSLADRVDRALVTASLGAGRPGLFAVGLDAPGVRHDPAAWSPRGLVEVTTTAVTFTDVPAEQVGGAGWYLDRPGFSWGGIGVAAVWFGAAAALAGSLWQAARTRPPDQVALVHMGSCDVALRGALLALQDAARAVDAAEAVGAEGALLAARVRAVVARAAEEVTTTVGHALGPGPLALDAEHAARVADLTLYLRQHHAERDLAALGRMLVPDEAASR